MNRREFMVAASGVAGAGVAATAATPVAAQDEENASGDDGGGAGDDGGDGGGEGEDGGGNESAEGGGDDGGGGTQEITVGPGGDPTFDPDSVSIQPGTTVHWVWDSDNHNIVPTEQPGDAEWEGHPDIVDSGEEYEYTFEVEGDYTYICEPHVGQGMEGTITVDPDAGGENVAAEVDVHDIGVPIQAHYVGIATILSIFVSIVFTFYLLKYGESAHTSSPGRR